MIIIIEPHDFVIEEVKHLKNSFNLVFVSSDLSLIEKYPNQKFIYSDIKTEFDSLVNKIKKIIFTIEHLSIITFRESHLIETSYLASIFDVNENDIELYRLARNKLLMKEKWLTVGVKTSNFYKYVDSLEINKINFPCILKPTSGYSSIGVRLVHCEEEFNSQIKTIKLQEKFLNSNEVCNEILIEEYFEGTEYSVDTIWKDSKPIYSVICEKYGTSPPYFEDSLYFIPENYDSSYHSNIINIANDSIYKLGIKTGVTHTEIKVNENYHSLIETTLRPGGNGLMYKLFLLASGVNFFELYFKVLKNLDNYHLRNPIPIAKYFLYDIKYVGSGYLTNNIFNKLKYIEKIVLFKKIGEFIPNSKNFGRGIGALINSYENKEILYDNYNRLFDIRIDFFD